MALTASERETTINWCDEDERIHISTSQRKIITKLLNNASVEIEDDRIHDGTRMIMATLPLGAITIRAKAAGTIKRKSKVKRGAPTAQKCSATKANGERCGSIAAKATGLCAKHRKAKS
jgi:hypothetical protein